MKTSLAKIGIYQTGEYGFHLFKSTMEELTACESRISIVPVSAQEIKSNALIEEGVVGLVMPGRNSGQDYRDELGPDGLAAVQDATRQGMSVLAVCAGSYILSREVHWQYDSQPSSAKRVINHSPLFDGTTVGAFNGLWPDGYRSSAGQSNAYISNILAAKVVDVAYTPALGVSKDTLNGHALYWGGGAFFPDRKSEKITPLAYHASPITIPDTPLKSLDLPAVISFQCGQGRVIFSNIHPEVNADRFHYLFLPTEKAQSMPDMFAKERRELETSAPMQKAIFSRFLDNCLYRANEIPSKKPVAMAGPSL